MSYELQSLLKSTHSRLLAINSTIRTQRKTLSKDALLYYKEKRKETDQLLSSLKCLQPCNLEQLCILKEQYMCFKIDDSRK